MIGVTVVNKNVLFNRIVRILLIACFVLLGIHTIFYILVASKSLINSDSAFIVDYALEAIKSNSLFPKDWVNTNDFWVYSLIPIIIPFIKMGVSLYLSRQFAVIIQTIALILLVIRFYSVLFDKAKSYIIFLIILLTGISGHFMFELFSDATYGTVILFMIFLVYLTFNYLKNGKIYNIILIAVLLAILTACSVRFPIYISAPIICVLLFDIYHHGFNKKNISAFAVVVAFTGTGMLLNKYLCSKLLISQNFNSHLIGNPSQVSNSLFSMIFYYLVVSGSTNLNIIGLSHYVTNDLIVSNSPLTIIVFIKFIYSIVTISLPLLLFVKFKKLEHYEKLFLIYVSSLVVILGYFLFSYSITVSFRYLTPVVFVLNMLYPFVYKYYFSDNVKNKIVFGIYVSLIAIASLFLVVNSYYDFDNKRKREIPTEELTKFLLDKDLHYGFSYLGSDAQNIYNTLTDGDLQVTIINQEGEPMFWLISKRWFRPGYYDGQVFFIRNNDEPVMVYEKQSIETYDYYNKKIFVFDSMDVFKDVFKNQSDDRVLQLWRNQ